MAQLPKKNQAALSIDPLEAKRSTSQAPCAQTKTRGMALEAQNLGLFGGVWCQNGQREQRELSRDEGTPGFIGSGPNPPLAQCWLTKRHTAGSELFEVRKRERKQQKPNARCGGCYFRRLLLFCCNCLKYGWLQESRCHFQRLWLFCIKMLVMAPQELQLTGRFAGCALRGGVRLASSIPFGMFQTVDIASARQRDTGKNMDLNHYQGWASPLF